MIKSSDLLSYQLSEDNKPDAFTLLGFKKKYTSGKLKELQDTILNNQAENGAIDSVSLFFLFSIDILLSLEIENNSSYKQLDIHNHFIQKNQSYFIERVQENQGLIPGLKDYLFALDLLFKKFIDDYFYPIDIAITPPQMEEMIQALSNIMMDHVSSDLAELCRNIKANLLKINTIFLKSKDQEKELDEPSNDMDLDIKKINRITKAQHALPKTAKLLQSEKMADFVKRIIYLQKLINENHFFEASIVLDDIQKKITSFDPRNYFPDLFIPMYRSIGPAARDLFAYIADHTENLEWNLAKRVYELDPHQFVNKPFIRSIKVQGGEDGYDQVNSHSSAFLDSMEERQPLFSDEEIHSSASDLEHIPQTYEDDNGEDNDLDDFSMEDDDHTKDRNNKLWSEIEADLPNDDEK